MFSIVYGFVIIHLFRKSLLDFMISIVSSNCFNNNNIKKKN